ncbi:MAG: hypothetical protein CSA62_01710 [Planctomycetota bacterium]|nr:MAG: hypothetical protein CSA62_01710 [Planctomycetota bacterium]
MPESFLVSKTIAMKPCQELEDAAQSLFAASCAVAVCSHETQALLNPQEELLVQGAVDKRKREFGAGRHAARACLAQLGVQGEPVLLKGEKREVLWPEAYVGAISHRPPCSVAVAAQKAQFRSLGLDIEKRGRVEAKLWRLIFVESELAWLRSQDAEQGLENATLLFSAKESLYKLQFPLSHEYVDFRQARLEHRGSHLAAWLPESIHERFAIKAPIEVGFAFTRDFVVSACSLARDATP